MIENGDRGAPGGRQARRGPTRFLSTVQIGITSIGVLNGVVGEAALARDRSANGSQAWACRSRRRPAIRRHGHRGGRPAPTSRSSSANWCPSASARWRRGHRPPVAPPDLVPSLRRPRRSSSCCGGSTAPGAAAARRQDRSRPGRDRGGDPRASWWKARRPASSSVTSTRWCATCSGLDDRQVGSLMVPRTDIVCLDVGLRPKQNLRARSRRSEHSRFPVVPRRPRTTCWAWSARGSCWPAACAASVPILTDGAPAGRVRARERHRHGAARQLPLVRRPDRLRDRRIRRGAGPGHAAGPDRGHHRRVQAR